MRVSSTLRICVSTCLIFMSFYTISSEELPILPEKKLHPYLVKNVINLESANQLTDLFSKNEYLLKNVLRDQVVPSYFVENLPSDLDTLPEEQKISVFLRLLLPTIKEVNQQITKVREELIRLAKKPEKDWSKEELEWVTEVEYIYGVKSHNIEQLLLQVDIVPIGMVLAQAIDESGWGTSYFAVKGNNLYGEHLSSHGGKFLTTPKGKIKVAAFDNLYSGTASYVHNLNSTFAYKNLWRVRKELRMKNNLTGYELVGTLEHYSSRGLSYVDNLRELIERHNLDDFDHIDLEQKNKVFIRFKN